jgi:hypothetical protein
MLTRPIIDRLAGESNEAGTPFNPKLASGKNLGVESHYVDSVGRRDDRPCSIHPLAGLAPRRLSSAGLSAGLLAAVGLRRRGRRRRGIWILQHMRIANRTGTGKIV